MPVPTTHADLRSKYEMDKGYSWVVMAASSVLLFILFGQILNFGIYFVVLLDHFQASNEAVALVGGLSCGFVDIFGPLASILQGKCGARLVIMTGGLLASLGFGLSYFATELWHLTLTYGCLVGFGYGLCVTPSFAVLPEYFEKHLYFVISFVAVGVAIGGWVFGPLNLLLIEIYTWRGSMLIQAGLALQVFLLGAFCKSRIVHAEVSLHSLLDWHVFKNARFILVMLDSIALGGVGITVLSMINALIIGRGLTAWQSAEIAAMAGAGGTAARVLITFVSHLERTDRTLIYSFSSLFIVLGTAGCVFSYDYWSFSMFLLLFGFGAGIKYSQCPNVIIELIGADKAAAGFGYFGFFLGIGDFVLPLFAGWLADRTDIHYAFALAAAIAMISFGLCCILLYLRHRTRIVLLVTETGGTEDTDDSTGVEKLKRTLHED